MTVLVTTSREARFVCSLEAVTRTSSVCLKSASRVRCCYNSELVLKVNGGWRTILRQTSKSSPSAHAFYAANASGVNTQEGMVQSTKSALLRTQRCALRERRRGYGVGA